MLPGQLPAKHCIGTTPQGSLHVNAPADAGVRGKIPIRSLYWAGSQAWRDQIEDGLSSAIYHQLKKGKLSPGFVLSPLVMACGEGCASIFASWEVQQVFRKPAAVRHGFVHQHRCPRLLLRKVKGKSQQRAAEKIWVHSDSLASPI
ncbi:hypothetical protein ACE103_08235 [Bradyrhizobium sp. ma5]|uniref:hypothetical protein n=1 Tax=Bradyrhizobium sp. ma5 TaxID=3344828 RepID=UPI0035D4CE62